MSCWRIDVNPDMPDANEHHSDGETNEQPLLPVAPLVESEHGESDAVRSVIAETRDNDAEVVVAPNQLLSQLDDQYLRGLETIPVSPEAPWDEAGERVLRDWMAEAKVTAAKQNAKARKLKYYHYIVSFLAISWAVLMTFASFFACSDLLGAKLTLSGLGAVQLGINLSVAFLNLGQRYQRHYEYEGKFFKFALDLEELLATDIDFRPPKDMTIRGLKEIKKSLLEAPDV